MNIIIKLLRNITLAFLVFVLGLVLFLPLKSNAENLNVNYSAMPQILIDKNLKSQKDDKKDLEEILKLIEKTKENQDILVIDIPETFMYMDADVWTNIENQLNNTKAKKVVFNMQGYGGLVSEGNKLIFAMNKAKARGIEIEAHLIGPNYSMHGFTACYASKITSENNGSLMFHAGRAYQSFLNGWFVISRVGTDPSFMANEQASLQECIKSGVITKQEAASILQNKEVYVTFINGVKQSYTVDNKEILEFVESLALLALYLALFIVMLVLIRRALHIK